MTNKTNIQDLIWWWADNYQHISTAEGWTVCSSSFNVPGQITSVKTYFIAPLSYSQPRIISHYQAINFAKNWGWLFDNTILIGFDMKRFNKVKHLIPCKELGLL